MPRPSSTPPTLQAIADRAQVTRATVSMALRDHPLVAARTRARIQALAQAMGYRPNPLVAALMTSIRTRPRPRRAGRFGTTLAWLNTKAAADVWQNRPDLAGFFTGAAARARQFGYNLDSFWVRGPRMSERRLNQILASRGIYGLVLTGSGKPFDEVHLDWSRFACASLFRTLWEPLVNNVCPAYSFNLFLALDHLRRQGYRRIGLVLSRQYDRITHSSIVGRYLADQQEVTPAHKVPLLLVDDAFRSRTPTDGARLLAWFREHRPEVILTRDFAVRDILAEANILAPRDVGLACLSHNPLGADWAGVDERYEIIGSKIVDVVVAQLQRNERGVPEVPTETLVRGRWVPGVTIREPRA